MKQKENLICRILGHKYNVDVVSVKKACNPSRVAIYHWKHCKRCDAMLKTYYGTHRKKNMDERYINFGDMDDRIYNEYNKLKELTIGK